MKTSAHQTDGFEAQACRDFVRRLARDVEAGIAIRPATGGQVLPPGSELEAQALDFIGIAGQFAVREPAGASVSGHARPCGDA